MEPAEQPSSIHPFDFWKIQAAFWFPAKIVKGQRRWPSPHFCKSGPGRRHNGLQRAAGSKFWRKVVKTNA